MHTALTIAAVAYWLRGKPITGMRPSEMILTLALPLLCLAAAIVEDIRAVF